MDHNTNHLRRKPETAVTRERSVGGVIVGLSMFACVIAVLVVCFAFAYPDINRDDYYREAFSDEDIAYVQRALDTAPVKMKYSAQSHLQLLFDAVWERESVEIDIVSASVIFLSKEQSSAIYGNDFSSGYVLKLTDAKHTEYMIWRSDTFHWVIKNEETLYFTYIFK